MMWDDHDIFDGWGSWPADRQSSPVYQGLFATARDQFALLQLGIDPATPGTLPGRDPTDSASHFGCCYRAGQIAILAPDLRTERTRQRIMGQSGWRWLETALSSLDDCRHLVLMSSVPLVNADLSLLERIFVALPGHSDLEDDLRDQWQSFAHRAEWHRMLDRLLRFITETGAAVTGLSGEIHLGALGRVEGAQAGFYELTSSGIVHPPPPAPLVLGLERCAPAGISLAPDLRAFRIAIPDHGRMYLRARNWLFLELSGDGDLAARWETEGGTAGRLVVPRPQVGRAPTRARTSEILDQT
jgi:hypothetical protein